MSRWFGAGRGVARRSDTGQGDPVACRGLPGGCACPRNVDFAAFCSKTAAHMRSPSTLDALFTVPRRGILAATLLEPEHWWYLSDLARHLRVHHATLQRELARLTKAEILLTKRDGNRAYYRANQDSPIFPELRSLLTKTAGLVETLRDTLHPFKKAIQVAFVYWSVARATEVSESDVDLMIVGRLSLRALAAGLRKTERKLRRPVNPSVYRAAEFARKLASGNPFLRRVLDKEKLFVVGAQSDLERLAQGRANRGSQPGSRGNRSTAAGR